MKWAVLFSTIFFSASVWATTPTPSKNPRVLYWIKVFQKNDQNYFNSWLAKSQKKLPKIKKLLRKQGLPEDLAYLPLIESGLNPKAISSANAVGYWQFMEPTAKHYGLKIDWWLDERRDLVKSTWAAGNYLKKLYFLFDDWYLALSAYNMGENRLARLIKQHKTRDFWVLSKKYNFPKETRHYVPKFLAAALIAKNPEHYGFKLDPRIKPATYAYQFVPGGTDLYRVAEQLKISKEDMKTLNPELLRAYVPEGVRSHRIRVPSSLRSKVALYFSKNLR